MVLSEYEAKRHELDEQMAKLNEMESEKKNGVVYQVPVRGQTHSVENRTIEARAKELVKGLSERQGVVAQKVQGRKAGRQRKDAPVASGISDGKQYRMQGNEKGRRR